MNTTRSFAFVTAVLLGVSGCVMAQTSEGRILGTVSDSSGAVITGANVTVTNTATNVARQLVTTSAGEYIAPNLEPGTYTVAAESKGFKKSVSKPFVLEVSRDVRIDLKLQPGAMSETMEVSAEGTLVDTSDATLNGVLSNKAISELPVDGRDFQNLLELHPGVQRTPGGGSNQSLPTATARTTTISSSMAPTTTMHTMAKASRTRPVSRAPPQASCPWMRFKSSIRKKAPPQTMASNRAW